MNEHDDSPTFRLRQRENLAYTTGRMAISAVPGNGKTFTLSLLAAKLIADHHFDPRAEPTGTCRHLSKRQRRHISGAKRLLGERARR